VQKKVNAEGTKSAEENRGREILEELRAIWLFHLFHHHHPFPFFTVSSAALRFPSLLFASRLWAKCLSAVPKIFHLFRHRIEIRVEPHLFLQFLPAMFIEHQQAASVKVSPLDPPLRQVKDFLEHV
jgi:hypothetical protein